MAMNPVRLRSDSPRAKCIVKSFIDFLSSVELAPGVDPEALEVATQCLNQAFALDGSSSEVSGVSLVDIFSQLPTSPIRMCRRNRTSSPAFPNEVYDEFLDGLESAGYFSADKELRVLQARSLFEETLKTSRGKSNSDLLAEAFKAQGNGSMESRRYVEAVELYTLAISVCNTNAIYFANRAAAHTLAGNPAAAIVDCHKAIEINPQYSKAYGRLGTVLYSQGKYEEAVEWFTKALDIDPFNSSALENRQLAQNKLDAMHDVYEHPDEPENDASSSARAAPHYQMFEPPSESQEQQHQQEQQFINLNLSEMIQDVAPVGNDREFANRLQAAIQSVLGAQPNTNSEHQQH